MKKTIKPIDSLIFVYTIIRLHSLYSENNMVMLLFR